MINLITNNPIALDSEDHIHPDGIYLDNNYNEQFSGTYRPYHPSETLMFCGQKL